MVIVLQTRRLEILPPLISLLRVLKALGERVVYLGLTDTPVARALLADIGIEYRLYNWPIITFKQRPFLRIWREVTKPIRHIIFRRWAWKQIEKFSKGEDDVVVWSAEMVSAAVLGNRALEMGTRHVHIFYELGDDVPKRASGFDKKRFYHAATIVECEKNRSAILRREQGLARTPFTLPNKAYGHPRNRNYAIKDASLARIVKTWGKRPVFLYQGGIQKDRLDVVQMIEWLCEGLPEAVVAVMARYEPIVDELASRYSNFFYIPYVSPPQHLEITSHATIGLAAYNGGAVFGLSPLNGVYCAPNKIFEYSGYGIPVLCNNIEGLRYTIGDAHAGICVEAWSRDDIVAAAKEILLKYKDFSDCAKKFFESVDILKIVSGILSFARKGE